MKKTILIAIMFLGVKTIANSQDIKSIFDKTKSQEIFLFGTNKSQDGYIVRVFVIAFTRESPNQKRKTKYALASQQKEIRKRINEIVSK